MCGIFGYIGNLPAGKAEACTANLAHRGPDGQGLWQKEHATLGHRRLAILDLSSLGHQPMPYGADRYWITYNGEIYNFLELREELKNLGHQFTTDTDTEVVLAAFAQWGAECLQRFNGMWAFAIWDERERSLFLSRDRLGKKPLFYTTLTNGDFAFASEMKGLFPLFSQVQPDAPFIRTLVDYDPVIGYESSEQCLIRGIRRFPAGHYGWVRNGKLKLTRWWHTLDHLVQVPTGYADQVAMLRELFIDSCRLRMRSDAATCTALSGGLDSSATIAAIAQLNGNGKERRLNTAAHTAFVASFPGTVLDETAYARAMLEHIGMEGHFITIDPLKLIAQQDEHFYLFEDLYLVSPAPYMATYGAIADHKIKVSIDGHGADELFGGYSSDSCQAIQDAGLNIFKLNEIFKTLEQCRTHHYTSCAGEFSRASQFKKWLKNQARYVAGKALGSRAPRFPEIRSRDMDHPNWSRLDYLTRRLYVSTHEEMLPTIFKCYDRYGMANGVEIRMPFMDHRIVSFAFSLPWSAKIRNGFSKAIVRDAMAPFMPESIAYRQAKIGFSTPIVDWLKGPLKEFCLDSVQSKAFRQCSLIDPKQVAAQLTQVIEEPAPRFDQAEIAWAKLSPFLWEQAMACHCPNFARSVHNE